MPKLRALCAAVWGKRALAGVASAPVLALFALAPNATESAKANGETRTLVLSEPHTNESGSFTYMVNGSYDPAALDKLNWFLRDWRHDEQTRMDPRLFDILWEVYRESGSSQPVEILSGYRSPETNAMLRRRSRLVAEHSLHIQGKAVDAHFVDVPTEKIREIAMRMQDGGVGFYPIGVTPWVHIDSGSVRSWPRMSRAALARLFPDGKTVHIPADGVPLAGYEQARAEIEARGGSVFAASAYAGHSKSLFAMLFGGGEDEGDEEAAVATGSDNPRGRGAVMSFAVASAQAPAGSAQPDPVSLAKRDLPKGETFIGPPPAANAAQPAAAAALDQRQNDDAGASTVAIPKPPRRPAFAAALGYAPAPTPPTRPTEFAAPQNQKNDATVALLTRKLPTVITRGLGGSLPQNALALTDPGGSQSPQRIALLAKAAALSASLPSAPPLTPLERAARLYAPLPPIGPLKPALVAAKIGPSDFGVMIAPKTPTVILGEAKAASISVSPRADALRVALAPIAEVAASFAPQPAASLPSDAFALGAVAPQPSSEQPGLASETLRGSD